MSFTDKEKEVLYVISRDASVTCDLHDDVENGIPFQKEQNDLYTLDEVAKVLSLSIVTVRHYVRSGRMKAIKQWKNWMVTSNELAKVKYERQHGVELPEGECMLALLAGELHEEGSRIENYVLCTAADLLQQIHEPYNTKVYEFLDKTFPDFNGPCTYIESVSSISDFFRRTWEVPYTDTLEKEDGVGELFASTDYELVIEELEGKVDELLEQEPAVALEFIENKFGKITDVRTVLRIYAMLLHEIQLNKGE